MQTGGRSMSQRLKAVYENGVLRPLTPLNLPEHSEVEIRVRRIESPSPPAAHRLRVRRALIEAGLSLATETAVAELEPLTDERREELSRLFSSKTPLSELIGEDREGR